MHYDAPLFSRSVWEQSLARWKQQLRRHRCLFLGVGDYLDGFSTSERAVLKDGKLHESTRDNLEGMQHGRVKLLAKELGFMKGHLIGLMNGNHYAEFMDGTNSDQRLCRELNCAYLGVETFIRISIRARGRPSTIVAVDIFAHHGKGAARLSGSPFNTVEQMSEFADADIFIMGDDHSRGVLPAKPFLRVHGTNPPSIAQRQRLLVRSGSYLQTHKPGTVSYIHDSARAPRSLGHVEVEIKAVRDRSGGTDRMNILLSGHSPGFEQP